MRTRAHLPPDGHHLSPPPCVPSLTPSSPALPQVTPGVPGVKPVLVELTDAKARRRLPPSSPLRIRGNPFLDACCAPAPDLSASVCA